MHVYMCTYTSRNERYLREYITINNKDKELHAENEKSF